MAWVRPRPSRAGQEGGVAGNSGGTGGSSLPGGGPAALGGGDTGLGRKREAGAPSIDATAVTTRWTRTSGNGPALLASGQPVAVDISSLGAILESKNPSTLSFPAKLPQLKPCLPMGTPLPAAWRTKPWPTLSSLKALSSSHAAGDEDRSFSVAMQIETRAAHQGHGQNYVGSGSG
jgi:hypothetical protein